MFAMAFATKNRIPSLHLTDTSRIEAKTMAPEMFVPSKEECEDLKASMKNLVKEIIVRHMTAFNEVEVTRLEAKFSRHSSKKSEVVITFCMQLNLKR